MHGFLFRLFSCGWVLGTCLAFSASDGPTARSRHGMVVSADPIASQIGRETLRHGGNAVDAAVATAFALAVVHPAAGNLGGGGFALVHWVRTGTETSFDFRETAPLKSTERMYLDASGAVIEGLSTKGHMASGVPGSVAGLHALWKKFGSRPWDELVGPAGRLAGEGFEVSSALSQSLLGARTLLSSHPESLRIFLRNGDLLQKGDRLTQPELARSLVLISLHGPDAFYRGEIARQIVAEMDRGKGILSLEDLASYEVKERTPVRGGYRGLEIVSMGPPSSGGIILLEMLNLAERFDLQSFGPASAGELMLKAEIGHRAFRDRSRWLGDSDFVDVPAARLTSKDYAARLGESIHPDRLTREPSSAERTIEWEEREETTHLSVIDGAGNCVALTTTINGSYGSGVTVAGAGFLLNNEMDDFAMGAMKPNMFGLVQGKANAIAPRKRPLSAMTPTFVKERGRVRMVLGSPGGPTIISTVFQIILNVVDHRMDLEQAVGAPRSHHQWFPDELAYEGESISAGVKAELESQGLKLRSRGRMGDAHCIAVDSGTGEYIGVPDPRGAGAARGY